MIKCSQAFYMSEWVVTSWNMPLKDQHRETVNAESRGFSPKSKVLCILSYHTVFPYLELQIITLSDLECDYINARSCCSKLNKVNCSSLHLLWFEETTSFIWVLQITGVWWVSEEPWLAVFCMCPLFQPACLFLDVHLSANSITEVLF